jgi:hypothetical protein
MQQISYVEKIGNTCIQPPVTISSLFGRRDIDDDIAYEREINRHNGRVRIKRPRSRLAGMEILHRLGDTEVWTALRLLVILPQQVDRSVMAILSKDLGL